MTRKSRVDARAGAVIAAAVAAALVLVLVLVLIVPGGKLGTSEAQARRAPFVATLSAPGGHNPKANKKWPITVTARTWSRRALSGRISYEFLFGGQVVARRSNYAFRNGRFSDTIVWPARSVGTRLTFQVVVKTKLGTVRLPYAVVVRK